MHPWNLAFLIGGLGSAFGLSLLPAVGSAAFNAMLLFTMAIELLALGYVPRQERFRRLILSQHAAEKKPPSQKELYRQLSRHNQRRYFRLRDLEKKIKLNYTKLSYAAQGLLESHEQKIDGLLNSCLSLLHQKERYDHYALRTGDDELRQAIAEVQQDMRKDSERLRNVKARRLRILQQRLERLQKSKENMRIIDAQVATIEDVVKYIHEQSITMRNPDEITYQLNLLLNEVEETETSVSEMETLFGVVDQYLSGLDLDSEGLGPQRERSTNS